MDTTPSVTILQKTFSHLIADFKKAWLPLLKVDLICRLVTYAALAPLVGLVLQGVMWFTGDTYVADFDLSGFFLSPLGIIGSCVVVTVVIAVVAIDQVCLMSIASATVNGQKQSIRHALWLGIKNLITAARLSGRVVVRSLVFALPFIAAGGLVFLLLLTEFDISYYLKDKPPVFIVACVLIGLIAAGMLYVLIPKWISWLFALPLILFEGVKVSKAIATSKELTFGSRKNFFKLLLVWFVGGLLLHFLVAEGIVLGGTWALGNLENAGRWFYIILALWIQLWFIATYLVSYVQNAAFSLLIVRAYHETQFPVGVNIPLDQSELLAREAPKKWVSTKLILGIVLLISAVLTLVGVGVLQDVHFGDEVAVVAHRGDSGNAPENTMAAVKLAIEAGVDWVEIDVQETLDGEVVVLHDKDLMRVGDLEANIWDLTLDDLQHIDVGSYFSPEFSDERVPTLEAVLRECKGKVGVIIELKFNEMSDLIAERSIQVVEDLGMEDEIMFMSLTFDGVDIVYDLRPSWKAGLATGVKIGDLSSAEADFFAVKHPIATRSFIRTAHARGKEVYVWTVDDPVDMHKFFSKGIDMIITNEPALAARILKERTEMGGAERILLELALFLDVDLGNR